SRLSCRRKARLATVSGRLKACCTRSNRWRSASRGPIKSIGGWAQLMSLGWGGFGWGFGSRAGFGFDRRGTQHLHLLLEEGGFLTLGQRVRLFQFDRFAARFGEALLEAFHAPGSIDKLLLSGEERVAIGANFKPDAGFGRARLKGVSTGAHDSAFHIFGMDSWPHKGVIVLINEGIVRPAGLIPYLVMEVRTR